MNYREINGRFYEADEGYVFQDKRDGSFVKMVLKSFINCYDCIPEPEPEPQPEQEVENNGESDVSV